MAKAHILVLFFLFTFIGYGQKYSFVTYSTEQGLPQSQVTAITQDDQGYLWVGTLGGLAKFGGNKFTTYSSNEGLLNNRVKCIEFFDETLWVGHDGGISYLKNNKVVSVAFTGNGNDQSRSVSDIFRFKTKIIVCSNGGGLFELKKDKLVVIPLDNIDYERVRSGYIYNDQLYLATKGGILISDDAKNFRLLEELGNISYSGVTGSKDYLVFSSYNHGVTLKDMKSGSVKHFSAEALKHSIYGCYFDRSDNIWLRSNGGVIKIDRFNEIQFLDDSNGLPVNMISCLYNDSEDNIWIGSSGKGIFRFPGEDFKYFDQSTGLPTDLFVTGFQDHKGDYFYGTFDKGILKKTANGKIEILPGAQKSIWASLSYVDGSHWFGTDRSLIEVKSDGRTIAYTSDENDEIPGTKVTALYKISSNSMYIGGNGGVTLYQNGTFKKLGKEKDQDIGTVRDFEVIDGTLYCGSNLGLLEFREGEFKLIPGSEQVVYNLEKDKHGNLWYGSEEGLYKMKEGKIERVELLNDPGSNFIAFLNYHDDKFFIGTNNGLFIVENLYEDELNINRFGIGEGIIDLETNLNSGFFDNQDNFWFGTASGLVCYHMKGSVKKSTKPKVNLTSILLNYEPFNYEKYADSITPKGFPKNLILPYSKNNLIFELDGISLVNHKGLRYQFWLEGLRDEWSSLTENNTITFTSLSAGDYLLHVRSIDIDGHVSDEIHFPFTINQAFYKTWWFISLIILGIAFVVLLAFRFRIRRLGVINEKEKLGFKSKLLTLEQRSMNASMNRHFIFNSLNSIQYFINTQDKVSANKYLTNFAKLIRKNLDSVTAEGNVISLEEELERLKLYMSLEAMRFKDRFDYSINTGDVDVESVKIPPMIMQPFIENSIIHGILPNEDKKGHINITVQIVEDHLEIKIEDNGIGIHESLSKKSISDGDHRSQGMEITSKRIELLQKVSGSEISLVGPEEIKNNDGSINGTRVLIKIPLSNLDI